MSGIATAVIGGAVISGVVASNSAGKAADAQERSTEQNITEQRRQFDATQDNLQPFQDAGVNALTSQQALVGLSGGDAQQSAFDNLKMSPGQQFIRDRQQKALLRSSAAIGGLGGGPVRTALQEQAAGFAMQDINNQFGRLGQIAGQGQNAATNVSQFGQQASQNIQNSNTNAANARASGIMNQNTAIQQGIGGISTGIGMALTPSATPPPPTSTIGII